MIKRILLFLLALPIWASAQITASNSSFSNGGGTGTDGTFTVTTLLGSSGSLLSGAPTATVAMADSLALVAFYNSTNGPSWTNKSNWLTGPVNTWYGVTVAANRVSQLILRGNNLTGALPDLSNITALAHLDLANNQIAGAIPTTLNNVTSLQLLNLYNNRFTGTIPSLASLTGLTFLSLGANPTFTAQNFPAFVFGLTNLAYLALDNIRLQGTLTAGFSGLNQLSYLNLSANANLFVATAQVEELGTLQNLQSLFLNNTNITGGLPASIAALPSLTILDINGCNFDALPTPSAWVNSSLAVNISNNLFDFGDLEPLAGIPYPVFTNTGQKQFSLFTQSIANPLKSLVGDPINIAPVLGGTQNSYQWLLNGNPISGATNPSLVILNPQLTDAGQYQLRVTNSLVPAITLTSFTQTYQFENRIETLFALDNQSIIHQDIATSSVGGYWTDIDQDGDEDLLVGNAFTATPNFLYENLGNGSFQKLTSGDIVTIPEGARYMSWGDYDNDGYPDVFAAEYATSGADDNISSLYRNNGDKTFSRTLFNHKGDGALWADYNNDGLLDLTVSNSIGTPSSNKLYKNKGDGTFELLDNWIPVSGTWYSGWIDIDNDGDLDYNITPGTLSNQIKIFRNNGNGTFAEENLPVPTGTFNHRGSSWGDIDGDGDMDLFAMNSASSTLSTFAESQFYINNGSGLFTMVPASARMGTMARGARGSTFGDADNDGDLDLFIIHRPVATNADVLPQLFLNDGTGNFTLTTAQFFGYADSFSGLSLADYNSDGALDLFIASFELGRPNYLFRNLQTSNGNNWLKLKLVGVQSNKTAIGARVDIYAGGKRMNRQIMPSSGLSSQNSYIVHIGLGTAAKADSVVIHWPSGIVQRLKNINAGQELRVIERLLPPPSVAKSDSLALVSFYNSTGGASWTNKTNWLTGPVNTWFGITVSNSRVTKLELNYNNLSGSLPTDLGNLNGLRNLALAGNKDLVGELPESIANLTQLEVLFFSDGNFSGPLFSHIIGLTSLKQISVEYCSFTGEIPSSIGTLTQLTSLVLWFNQFTGSIPSEIGNLTNLQYLYLGSPGMNGTIPPSIFSLPNLRAFGLNELPINGPIPSGIFSMTQLWFLYLNNCQLTGTIPDQFSGFNSLINLSFRGNQLQGTIPNSLANNSSIRGIDLSGNNLSDPIPVSLAARNISELNISNNQFTNLPVFQSVQRLLVTNNRFDFGDLEPNRLISDFSYVPQQPYVEEVLNLSIGDSLVLDFNVGGTQTQYYWYGPGGAGPNTPSFKAKITSVLDSGIYSVFAINSLVPNLFLNKNFRVRVSNPVSAPTVAATDINFNNVTSTTIQVSFTHGDGEQRLAILKQGSAPAFVPKDDAFYSGNLGNGEQVVYNGTGNSFTLSQLQPDTEYFVTVYEFNTDSTLTKYLTAGAPVASQRTLTIPVVFVTTPANGAVNQNAALNVTARAVTGATAYTIELSMDPAFINPEVRTGGRTLNFDSLQYNTLYYTRVKTNLRNDYGQVTTFTTRTAESLAFVTTPANNAVNISTALNITSNTVLYATSYTIQLSETPDFSTIDFETSGPNRTLAFTGLKFNTVYYNRVKTNLSPEFGEVRSFTTRTAESVAYVTSPGNNAININTVLNVSSNTVSGATQYTIQLSETADFTTIDFEVTGSTRTLAFSGLKYNTVYYNRVRTDLSPEFGQVRSFTTRTPESIAYVSSPGNNAMGASTVLNISSNIVPGATQYTIQLSETADFVTINFEVSGNTRTLAFSGLKYNTTYYNRVLTNLTTNFGQVRSFSTRTAESLAFVTSPANNAVNVNNTALNITANTVPGASTYTIQLSESPDFTTVDFEVTGPTRTLAFANLKYNTMYYNRVLTDLTSEYGQVRSFTTRTAESLAYVTNPANGAVNRATALSITANTVPGATSYTIQLSEASDFSTIAFEVTGTTRTLAFSGLITGTTYFNRVLTNLTSVYGAVRSFTTQGVRPSGARIAADSKPSAAEPSREVKEFEVSVYPNPFREKLVFYIESVDPQAEITLTDLNGRNIHQSTEKTNQKIQIEKEFAPGAYLLRIKTDHYFENIRVVRID